jgi:hypothetical protein
MKRQPSKVGVTFFFMLACNILTMVIRGDKHTTNTLISNHRSRWLLHQSVGRFYSRNGQQRATLLSTRSHGDVHEQNKSKHTHTRTPLLSPFSCVDLWCGTELLDLDDSSPWHAPRRVSVVSPSCYRRDCNKISGQHITARPQNQWTTFSVASSTIGTTLRKSAFRVYMIGFL